MPHESGDIFVCTKEDPWKPEKGDRAIHPDAVSCEGGDDYDAYECPHCGKYFKLELPQ